MLSDLHNHSTFSDGVNTCEELVEQAVSLGLRRIGLVEHVWRISEWVPGFIDTAERLKEKYDGVIQIVTGLEAKAITCAGDVDLNDQWRDKVDYVLGAIHRIPSRNGGFYRSGDPTLNKDKAFEDWLATVTGVLRNNRIDIIAHPAAELAHYSIPLDTQTIIELCDIGEKSGKTFEINVKHKAPTKEFLTCLLEMNIPLSVGSDSHSTAEQQLYIKDIIALHKAVFSCRFI